MKPHRDYLAGFEVAIFDVLPSWRKCFGAANVSGEEMRSGLKFRRDD